jgi:hypothetical protein
MKAGWLAWIVPLLIAGPAYAGDFLVVTDTFQSQHEAQTRAASIGGWALDTDAYTGLRPGLFAVVRGPYASRATAEQRLKRLNTGGRYKGAYVKDAGDLRLPLAVSKNVPLKALAALLGELSISVKDIAGKEDSPCEPQEPYQEITLSFVTLDKTFDEKTGNVDGKPRREELDIGGFWIIKSTGEILRMRICTE